MMNSDYVTDSIEVLPQERRLMWEAKSGSADAFVRLYDAYVERVYRYVYFRVSDDMAAESITSRVFVKAWAYIGRYPIILSPFFAWLCRIARSEVTEYYRTHPRIPGLDDGLQLIVAESGGLDERVQDIFDLQAMRDALRFLTEEQRQVLILKFIAGLPTEAIARMMARREETVREIEVSALQVLARIEARKDTNRQDFQQIVEACLAKLMEGTATVDQCLALYPEYARQFRPLVRTVLFLNLARQAKPSPAFSAHARANLTEYLRFHARQPRPAPTLRRVALTVAMVIAALLVTGTAHAQASLPGEPFYGWKRTSEKVWRAASLDPVATDIMIANRRVEEWLATADDPNRNASALDGYSEVISRLEATQDAETLARMVPMVQTHQVILDDAGLSNSQLAIYVETELASLPVVVIPPVSPTQGPGPQPTASSAAIVQPTVAATHFEPTAFPTGIQEQPTAVVVPTQVPPTAVPPTVIPPTPEPPTVIPPTHEPPGPPTEIPPSHEPPEPPTEIPPPQGPSPIATDPVEVPTEEPPTAPAPPVSLESIENLHP